MADGTIEQRLEAVHQLIRLFRPERMAYLLVATFIGGFAYLVAKMPRNTDIDPWDDGARL